MSTPRPTEDSWTENHQRRSREIKDDIGHALLKLKPELAKIIAAKIVEATGYKPHAKPLAMAGAFSIEFSVLEALDNFNDYFEESDWVEATAFWEGR